MLVENATEDGDETRSLQRESSEIKGINSLPKEFPASTNILIVDSNFVTLHDMKQIMQQYAYEATIYADAEEALAFLTNCKHGINIVIWDLHMPEINGIQALKIIGEKMDLPVIIMSDDDQVDSVMEAMMNGACYFVTKPVGQSIIANIWQHIVRKRIMSKRVPLALVHNNVGGLKQDKDDSETAKIPSDGLDQDSEDSKTINQSNDEKDMEKKKGKRPRITWTGDIQQKFLKAIDLLGGPKRANPKKLLKCLHGMNIKGLTRGNVSSHLQKHRISLEENQIAEEMREKGWSHANRPMFLVGPSNVHTAPQSTGLGENQIVQEMREKGWSHANWPMSLAGPSNVHTAPQSPSLEENQIAQEMREKGWSHANWPLVGPSNVHTAPQSTSLEENQIAQEMREKGRSHANWPMSLVGPSIVHTAPQSTSLEENQIAQEMREKWSHANWPTSLVGPSNVHTAPQSTSLEENQIAQEMREKGWSHANWPTSLVGPSNVHTAPQSTSLEKNQIAQEMREKGWSHAKWPMSLVGPSNVHPATSSLMNVPSVNPVEENQYPNGYNLTVNNNQFMTDPLPPLPNSDHHHLQQEHPQQQYQLPHQLDYVVKNQEPEQAPAITDFGLTDPSLQYDPEGFSTDGYNFTY